MPELGPMELGPIEILYGLDALGAKNGYGAFYYSTLGGPPDVIGTQTLSFRSNSFGGWGGDIFSGLGGSVFFSANSLLREYVGLGAAYSFSGYFNASLSTPGLPISLSNNASLLAALVPVPSVIPGPSNNVVPTAQPIYYPPVAVNDTSAGGTAAVEAGGTNNSTSGVAGTGNVLSNDIDVDNPGSLVVTAVRTGTWEGAGAAASPGAGLAGAYGTLVLNANGFYSYSVNDNNSAVQALNVGGTLIDSFNYTVQDPGGLTDTAVLTVTINGTNDAAVITGSSTAALTETNAALSTGGDLDASDVDSAATFVVQTGVAGSNGYGTFSIAASGAWTYTMDE
jgi:VCBS repeat-containing protein